MRVGFQDLSTCALMSRKIFLATCIACHGVFVLGRRDAGTGRVLHSRCPAESCLRQLGAVLRRARGRVTLRYTACLCCPLSTHGLLPQHCQ